MSDGVNGGLVGWCSAAEGREPSNFLSFPGPNKTKPRNEVK